jgi:competence protein ComEA
MKLAGLALGMLLLSGIGVASILSNSSGVPVPLAGMLGSDVHAAWLASKPAASAHANAPASAASTVASTAPQSEVKSSTGAPAAGAGGAATANAAPNAGGAGSASAGLTADGKVILNLATVEDLRHLPGVGQKRADAILALRARLGHFKHVNDLLRVKGIGVRGLKKILPHVLIDAPMAPAA